jgi:M6 family metalloprotease-like protein
MRRQQAKRPLTRGVSELALQRRRIGDYVGLCLPVEFPDFPASIDRDEIDAFCNRSGYGGFGNNGSVSDYFFENSAGKLRYTNIVAPYYKARRPRTYYTDEAVPDTVRAHELIREVLQHHIERGFPFQELSTDSNGCVYALNVFYAGPLTNSWPKGLWPHCHSLTESLELAPGVFASDYQITNLGEELALGTFCHENGHMLCDFPDLYDDDAVPESRGVGQYCLMCTGCACDEKNPANVSAYLKYQAGWCEASEIRGTLNATAGAGKNEVFVHHRSPNEYFIIENRHRSGRDAGLPASGLAIWHVDELADNCRQEMTEDCHYECSLEQADGECHLERNANDGDESDLFHADGNNRFADDTTPNSRWWDGTPSKLEVYDVGPAAATIRFSAAVRRRNA